MPEVEPVRDGGDGERRRRGRRRLKPVRGVGAPASRGGGGREGGPLVVGRDAEVLAQILHLGSAQQLRVVERIAGKGEAVALDRVGEDDRGRIRYRIRFRQHFQQARQVVPAKVGDQAA